MSVPPTQPAPASPYVLVLGTAQDGGLPQIGCDNDACNRARSDDKRRRLVASLLLCDPRSAQRWLFDATPDLREQVAVAAGHPATRKPEGRRPALFEGVFLTHAHMGHYTGLMYLGRESYGAKQLPVYGTERMRRFLSDNGPWSQLVQLENISLRPLLPDQPVQLATGLSVTRSSYRTATNSPTRSRSSFAVRAAACSTCRTSTNGTSGSGGSKMCSPV